MFGGFVSQPLKKQRDYYGNGTCFVFSVFPATKIYSWTKKWVLLLLSVVKPLGVILHFSLHYCTDILVCVGVIYSCVCGFRNDYFCHVSDRHVCMGGGGEGFAFLLDDELSLGSSNRCVHCCVVVIVILNVLVRVKSWTIWDMKLCLLFSRVVQLLSLLLYFFDYRSETFQNTPLSFKEQFQCTELELLTFE